MHTPEMSEAEKRLQAQFNPASIRRFTSTAKDAAKSDYVEELALDENRRGAMPLTREDFVVAENPARVEWERQVRKFLANLNTSDFGHKVTAPMIYEWTTGINLRQLQIEEGSLDKDPKGGGQWGSANRHLRHINWILREYFGKPRETTIAGRKVGKAYSVRKSFKVKDKRPACLTLWAEWKDGVLRP